MFYLDTKSNLKEAKKKEIYQNQSKYPQLSFDLTSANVIALLCYLKSANFSFGLRSIQFALDHKTQQKIKQNWGHENGHQNQHNNKLKIAFLSFYLLSSPVIVNRQ